MGRLIHIISSNSWGGKERYVLDVCRYFQTQSWRVCVYTRDARVVDDEFKKSGIDLRHAPLMGLYDLSSVTLLAKDFRKEARGSVVHVHRFRDAFIVLCARKLSRRKDIRVVYTHHTAKPGYDNLLARWVYKNVDKHIFVSHLAKKSFLSSWDKSGSPLREESIKVLHNSIYYQQMEMEPEHQSGPIVAMYHGRLSPEKGVEILIDALASLKGQRMRLWIVGTGDPDYVDGLKRRAMSQGVFEMIDWKGHVKDVHECIRMSHFGILPSLWEEGFGLANIEYMANGRPQICSNNGAQSEYLTEGEEALMVSPGDAEALSGALKRLLDNPEMRRDMGVKAYNKFASDLSWNIFSREMQEVYKD